MNLELKSFPFELKATSGDGSEFEGYASVFHNADSYGDIVAPGAFSESIPEFLKTGLICWQHDWETPIGRPTAAVEDGKGLAIKGRISDTTAGRDCKTLMKDGVVSKLSIGYRTMGREYLESADDVAAYWQKNGYTPTEEDISNAQYGSRLLTKIKLYEFSPVSVPANSQCDITHVKDGEGAAPGARSFADHSQAVLDTVSEYIERARGYLAMCAKDGREPNPSHLIEFRRLHAELASLMEEAKDAPPQVNLDHLFASFLEIDSRLKGVGV